MLKKNKQRIEKRKAVQTKAKIMSSLPTQPHRRRAAPSRCSPACHPPRWPTPVPLSTVAILWKRFLPGPTRTMCGFRPRGRSPPAMEIEMVVFIA